mgnify:CR=1 FL=1
MPLVNGCDQLREARDKGHALFSVVGGNLEMVLGSIQAAEEKQSPLILLYVSGIFTQIPMKHGLPVILNAAEASTVPVAAAVLEKGPDLSRIEKALELGAKRIMFDCSHLAFEDNVAATRKAVERAGAYGAGVEGRLGGMAENNGRTSDMTDPEKAAEFAVRTNVDSLGISFGNTVGAYEGGPNFDFDRLCHIREHADVPLVMHGGSGLEKEDYRALTRQGISWFCCYSTLSRGAVEAIGQSIHEDSDKTVLYHDLIHRAKEYFYSSTLEMIEKIGCSGKAS